MFDIWIFQIYIYRYTKTSTYWKLYECWLKHNQWFGHNFPKFRRYEMLIKGFEGNCGVHLSRLCPIYAVLQQNNEHHVQKNISVWKCIFIIILNFKHKQWSFDFEVLPGSFHHSLGIDIGQHRLLSDHPCRFTQKTKTKKMVAVLKKCCSPYIAGLSSI